MRAEPAARAQICSGAGRVPVAHQDATAAGVVACRARHRARHRDRAEEGFTLIELMVVVLILAVLLAIAIPTLLDAQTRGNDRATQSSLRNAVTVAKAMASDEEGYFRKPDPLLTYAAITAGDLGIDEPALDFVGNADAGSQTLIGVSVSPAPFDEILLVRQSRAKDNFYWGVWAHQDGRVRYCKATTNATINLTNCTAASFRDAPPLP